MKCATLIRRITDILSVLHKMDLRTLEVTFLCPQNLHFAQLTAPTANHCHFDGQSIAQCIVHRILHSHALCPSLRLIDVASSHTALDRDALCADHPRLRCALRFVADLATNEFGQSALHIAVLANDVPFATRLLSLGVFGDARDGRGSSPCSKRRCVIFL